MKARITQLDKGEILRYLGYHGQHLEPPEQEQTDRCIEAVLRAADPRLVYRRLAVKDGRTVYFPLPGNDIAALLASSREAVVFAATLGAGVERLLMRSGTVNMADALIMDACASTAIENVCDNFEADLREELSQGNGPAGQIYLTDRFSPGYGDLPLSIQDPLCAMLDTTRRIGLTVTKNHLMVPRKSVTAVIGISDIPQPKRSVCESCGMHDSCAFRKTGRGCGREGNSRGNSPAASMK